MQKNTPIDNYGKLSAERALPLQIKMEFLIVSSMFINNFTTVITIFSLGSCGGLQPEKAGFCS